jgi:DNA-binding MarR family transcriptional regulator
LPKRRPCGAWLTAQVDINMMKGMSTVPFDTTLRVRDCCLCLHVQRAARALARRFDVALKPVGLTNQQFSMMMALNRPKPAGMGAVAGLLGMDRTTLTAALKTLERRGLVRLAADAEDRRGKVIALTAEGMEVLARGVPIWERVHAELEAMLGEGEGDRLRRGLGTVSGAG